MADLKRFFVDEVNSSDGRFISFGVMDRANPDDIIADFPTRAEAETEAGLCNECPDEMDVEIRFCKGEHRLRLMEGGL
jgi:hypothetical protein